MFQQISDYTPPQWPGQAQSLVDAALADAGGGVLLVDAAPGEDAAEVLEVLIGRMRGDDTVVVLTGESADLARLAHAVPGLGEVFGGRWDMPAYGPAELGEIVVRHLERRGHEIPDDVRDAVAALTADLAEPTAHAAHTLATSLSRLAASRTLALADLQGPAARAGGLTAVG